MRSARYKVRTQSVALGDDSDLRWVSMIPEGAIFAHGMEWRDGVRGFEVEVEQRG